MTNRELLELAAKAYGICLEWDGNQDDWQPMYYDGKTYHAWDPSEDDGDSRRLQVKLQINICFGANYVIADGAQLPTVNNANDQFAAVRYAVLRAAADIGKDMT